MNIINSKWPGIFFAENGKKHPATLNLVPGMSVYGEQLVKFEGKEYRIWDPNRSKLGAAIAKGIKDVPIKSGMTVLYLGSASGTTASHVSDIIGEHGRLFGVDIAPRVMRDFVFLCEKRKNMVPILADATKPDEYSAMVGKVDFVFEDVAMPNQTEILIENCKRFLKKGGFAMIAIKARSIDVAAEPNEIYKKVEAELTKHFEIIDKKELKPYEIDHMIFLLKR
jgi:fibrillarin-like pre-rRNA processing protein